MVPFEGCSEVMGDAGRARLHTPMTRVNFLMGKDGPVIRRMVQMLLHILVQGPLITLQRQHVIATFR